MQVSAGKDVSQHEWGHLHGSFALSGSGKGLGRQTSCQALSRSLKRSRCFTDFPILLNGEAVFNVAFIRGKRAEFSKLYSREP